MGRRALYSERMAESMEAAKILAQRNKMRPAHRVQPSLKPRFMKEVKPPKKSEKEQKYMCYQGDESQEDRGGHENQILQKHLRR